jgi:FMN-dependent oxidoreductase (nitrilotriacetate monooxygenase family)
MKMLLGAFEMVNPNNGMPTWTHPDGRGEDWDDLAHWMSLAKTLDAAGFDFLFFADTYGYPTLDGRVPDETVAHGIQFPALDPMLMIVALAAQTSSLGFVVTSPTVAERPYATARRFATLDRLTGGRIGWNVVTGSSQATTDALFGLDAPNGGGIPGSHDTRYDAADEFVELCLRFWEQSWDDDAEVRDRSRNVYADPSKVRPVSFEGVHHRGHGVFAVPPTPQRTPVLFQAGTSDRGRAFAARNAEAVFIQGQSIPQAAGVVADVRARAVAAGRPADDIAVISGATIIVAPTSEEAHARRAELDALYALDDAAVMFAGFTGVDLTREDPDTLLEDVVLPAGGAQGQTLLDRYRAQGSVRVRDVLDGFRRRGIRGFLVTGSPIEVADELETIARETGLAGFMLEPTFGGLGCFEDFCELVVPILRERGLLADDPGPTLRERMHPGGGPRLAPTHPAASLRTHP